MSQIEHFMQHPLEVQEQTIMNLTGMARHTEWGKKFGYPDMQNIEQFQEKVPVSAYEDIFPYIDRMMRGEQKLLWPTKVTWFAKSSGTTNARSKFIPVTEESLEECHVKGGKDMYAMYINRFPETRIFNGKSVGVGGSYQRSHLNNGMYYGDVSAVIMKNLPLWAEFKRAPGLDVALMAKWEEKIQKMAER